MLKIIVNNIENPSDKKKAFEIRDLVFCKEQKQIVRGFESCQALCAHCAQRHVAKGV